MPRRLVLFSGITGDRRLFAKLSVHGVALETPDHVEPRDGESLEGYADRLVQAHGITPETAVGGASFGGMVAAQIAASRPVAGLIVLGSCLRPAALPASYRWLERVGDWIPDRLLLLRTAAPLMQRRLGPLAEDDIAVLVAMAREAPPFYLRRFARMMFRWPGAQEHGCPRLVVHGRLDRTIPPRAALSPDVWLDDAGHCFTLSHPERVSEAIGRFMSGLAA